MLQQGYDYPAASVWLDQYIVIDDRNATVYRNWFHDYSLDALNYALTASGFVTRHVWNDHQTKIAGAHIALAALEHGIGSCWVSRFEVKRLAKLLNLSQGYLPSELLALGYPMRKLSPRPKKRLDEVVFYNTYQV